MCFPDNRTYHLDRLKEIGPEAAPDNALAARLGLLFTALGLITKSRSPGV